MLVRRQKLVDIICVVRGRFLRNIGGMVKFRAATVLNFNLEIEDKYYIN